MAELPYKVDTSVTVEQLQLMVGTQDKPVITEVEKGFVRRYMESVGDDNLLWQDAEYARSGSYGKVVAPPYVLFGLNMMGSLLPDIPRPKERVLDGGAEWEFFRPVEPGDVISATTKLANIIERDMKGLGKAVFFTMETIHTNQKNELVAKSSGTTILY